MYSTIVGSFASLSSCYCIIITYCWTRPQYLMTYLPLGVKLPPQLLTLCRGYDASTLFEIYKPVRSVAVSKLCTLPMYRLTLLLHDNHHKLKWIQREVLKIPKEKPETLKGRTDNTMANRNLRIVYYDLF
jgi:hypothetical protein